VGQTVRAGAARAKAIGREDKDSEPFDHDENWITVPEDHVVLAKAGERVTPLFQDQRQAAESQPPPQPIRFY
jgi:hypothetical protein